jgi:hypothetical protein
MGAIFWRLLAGRSSVDSCAVPLAQIWRPHPSQVFESDHRLGSTSGHRYRVPYSILQNEVASGKSVQETTPTHSSFHLFTTVPVHM